MTKREELVKLAKKLNVKLSDHRAWDNYKMMAISLPDGGFTLVYSFINFSRDQVAIHASGIGYFTGAEENLRKLVQLS